jgi:ACS family pantothenate transporter-like MFS transporter
MHKPVTKLELANAYVSGMKEDLNFSGADYNLLSTFFIIGYIIGQVPSQLVLTRGLSLKFHCI